MYDSLQQSCNLLDLEDVEYILVFEVFHLEQRLVYFRLLAIIFQINDYHHEKETTY